jgi:hypothetical protein
MAKKAKPPTRHPMDGFRHQYMQAMRVQAPAMFKSLSKSGQLKIRPAALPISMTLAIAHRDKDGRAILDAVRERKPPA